ncbi:MAG: GNAT family N-acetyltransferase [Oscillospiraceae bacterium]|jgi:GNAT superfamily N-acetyltransferase|nr:GNAT family N-acetyltransferase [Oscillospiraceae bacterium]
MIRLAQAKDFKHLKPHNEAAVRILALAASYGVECKFIRFWCDSDRQLFIAAMDSHAVISVDVNIDFNELYIFLSMQQDIKSVRTSRFAAQKLAAAGGWKYKSGIVMTAGKELQSPVLKPISLTPRDVYPLLKACFDTGLPEFDTWYVDVSHRLRRGLCRMVGFCIDSVPVACAMTTAECENAAVIGGVATLPRARGRGFASANVLTQTHQLLGEKKKVFLSPKNDAAYKLYFKIGFVRCGEWADMILTERI